MSEEKEILKEIILGYESECPLCGHKSFGKTKKLSQKAHEKHIDNDCKIAKVAKYIEKDYPNATMADIIWFATGKVIKGRKVFKDM